MAAKSPTLSRRARQALDLIYKTGEMTANDLWEAFPDIPSYSAARSILRNLEKKGHIQHQKRGARYVFLPTTSPEQAKKRALGHVIETFFNGSKLSAMKALFGDGGADLNEEALQELETMIERARKEEKP